MKAPSSPVARAAGTSLLIASSALFATHAADAQTRANAPTRANAQTRADEPPTPWTDSQTTLGFAANGAFFDHSYGLSGDVRAQADLYLTLRPRYRVHRMLQLRAYWDFDVELTDADDTTTRHELRVYDPALALWFDGIPALGGLRTSVAVALTAPVSERSRADTMILATTLLAQAHWSAPLARGTFRAIARAGWTHWFHQYTTPGLRGEIPYARSCVTVSGDCSGQLRGITSVHDELDWNLTVTQAWDVLSPGVSFGMFHQWPYDVAATIGPTIGVISGSATRVYSDFAFWLDVMPTSGLTVEAGYSLTRSIVDGEGHYGNPFYDRFQNWRVYLSVTFALDRLLDGRSHSERGIVRW